MNTQLLSIGHGLFAIVDAGILDEVGVVNFRDGRQWTGLIGSIEWRAVDVGGGVYVGKFMTVAGKSSLLLLHRAITAAASGRIVDHRNGNPLDNTRLNLRECDHTGNMANRKMQENKTGFKGVFITPHGRFRAYISKNGKTIHLGSFGTAQEAADAYDEAAIRIYGEFARPNNRPEATS